MSTEQRQPAPPRKPGKPFYFNTSEHLLRIGRERAGTLCELLDALRKGKPTIAGAVGGIPNQIIHKLTGVLVHSVEGCAFQIRYLLTHPEFAGRIGLNGREHVRENFLITSDVKRWLLLFRTLCGRQPA